MFWDFRDTRGVFGILLRIKNSGYIEMDPVVSARYFRTGPLSCTRGMAAICETNK